MNPKTETDEQEPAATVAGDEPQDGGGEGAGDYPQITLDKSNPDIAEAFANCKPGDMYRVVSDDENEVVLEKSGGADEGDETPDKRPDAYSDKVDTNDNPKTSDNPAIVALIGKKNKR